MRAPAVLVGVLLLSAPALAQPAPPDGVARLLTSLEHAVQSGTASDYLALLAPSADRGRARDFTAAEFAAGVTRVTIHERDRGALPGVATVVGRRLLVESLIESGARARIATWRLDIRRPSAELDEGWQIQDEENLTSVENLYRLSLDTTRQLDAHDLTISAEDLDLTLPRGAVFVVTTDQGVTGMVLLGRGAMKFRPGPDTERGQVKIFCGAETLETPFDGAFIRLNPGDYERLVDSQHVTPRTVDTALWRRADEMFREDAPKSFSIDLDDFGRDTWWMLPQSGDFLAEVRTRRFGTLTYARSSGDPEDITLFDRKKRHNIAVYPSRDTLARRGPFYDEDAKIDYDVLEYDIDVSVAPERSWIDGLARLRLKIRSAAVSTLTIRLANPLVVRSVSSLEYGRLLAFRVRDQNSIVINLPAVLQHDDQVNLAIAYSGRLEPQAPDSETMGAPQQRGSGFGQVATTEEESVFTAEPNYVYSNRSYWYPQSTVTDYATGILRITVPVQFDCVASGEMMAGAPTLLPAADGEPARRFYVFTIPRPARYFAFVISRLDRVSTATVVLSNAIRRDAAQAGGPDALPPIDNIQVTLEVNRRLIPRTRETADRIIDILEYYTALIGDCPYPSFTAAVVERDLPGGHSPAYFAVIHQPTGAVSPSAWRNDPASFPAYPEFFLAHEMAHQWWGQAVGWRNYHEQWLSEAFAQYFAALYADHHRGSEVFDGILRQFRRWTFEDTDQGPVYLGYRLGHVRGEGRVFRAVVYNKGAGVLHMLRRLLGDDAFFRAVRRFYRESRFTKASTEGLRAAMEAESGKSLGRFFERWIYGSTLPRLKFRYQVDREEVVLQIEQLGELFDVPVTVRLDYADAKPVDIVVAVTDRVTEQRVKLSGRLRGVELRTDDVLADIVR